MHLYERSASRIPQERKSNFTVLFTYRVNAFEVVWMSIWMALKKSIQSIFFAERGLLANLSSLFRTSEHPEFEFCGFRLDNILLEVCFSCWCCLYMIRESHIFSDCRYGFMATAMSLFLSLLLTQKWKQLNSGLQRMVYQGTLMPFAKIPEWKNTYLVTLRRLQKKRRF